MDTGFVKANSTNLPRIDAVMVAIFFASNTDFFSPEQRNVKTSVSARESYGDDAIGYVQLKREADICIVKCKICPEIKVHAKQYNVSVQVNEDKEHIESALCNDCVAGVGGCKHAVAVLMWLHRRSEEPSCTSVECYWRKSSLAKVGSSLKIITAKEMCKRKRPDAIPDTSVLLGFIDECKKRKIGSCQFLKHIDDDDDDDYTENRFVLSMHYLVNKYKDKDCESFLTKIKNVCSSKKVKDAEMKTRCQNKSGLWFELRYGRVTASKCYEVSRCKTTDGSLVAVIFGARLLETPAIKRGQLLEDQVREVVEEQLGVKFNKCCLFISEEYPMIAGSPDGINENSLIEIKCPSSEKNYKYYIKDGKLTKKCLAQVQLQMFCAKVNHSYFCVANCDFEKTQKSNNIACQI